MKSPKARSPEVTWHDDVTQGNVDFLSPCHVSVRMVLLMTLLDQKQ
jgi:hypothetical protein